MARRLLAAIAAAIALSVAPAAALPQPDAFTLRNGMQVVVIEDRRAPVVTHMVWYRVGAADEPRGASGIAHYFEHLMFKGTRAVPSGEFSRIVARNGGEDNAFTSWDYTAYFQRIAADRLDLVMRMEADRMRNLRLSADVIAAERDVIVEERRQRTDNNPGAVLNERMRAMLYPHHPYGTPVIGWLHEIEALDLAQAEAFYRTWYAPNNAILVVAGDVDAATVRALAERTYGRVRPTRNLPPRAWTRDPPDVGPMRVSHADPKVRQPSLSRLYRSLSYSTDTGRQAHALDVAVEILGGSETSRLYRAWWRRKASPSAQGPRRIRRGSAAGWFRSTPRRPQDAPSLRWRPRSTKRCVPSCATGRARLNWRARKPRSPPRRSTPRTARRLWRGFSAHLWRKEKALKMSCAGRTTSWPSRRTTSSPPRAPRSMRTARSQACCCRRRRRHERCAARLPRDCNSAVHGGGVDSEHGQRPRTERRWACGGSRSGGRARSVSRRDRGVARLGFHRADDRVARLVARRRRL
jgi:hypothetical protein